MRALQALLALSSLLLLVYTGWVWVELGPNFLPAYLQGFSGVSWQGQFNLDFTVYLLLSGLWVAWRHRFSPLGIALGALALLGGLCLFGPYLLWASARADSVTGLLLGERA